MKQRQRISNPSAWKPLLDEWEIHVGYRFLYIVGPGPEAMRRCSRPSWEPGTEDELSIAKMAVAMLNKNHRENPADGEQAILSALIACGYKEEWT